MSNYAPTPDWQGAVSALRQAQSVLLVAHVTPDADALGSALALGMALRELGKEVQVSVGEIGFKVPDSLAFLPGVELVVSPEDVVLPDLVVSCDTSSLERLGTLADTVTAAQISIAIDHHPTFNGFGTIHIIDTASPATAALVLQLIDMLDLQLNRDIAAAIYAGLGTDTGSFKFQGTTSETLRTAARLFDAGIDHSTLARLLFDDEPFAALQMLGAALNNAVLNKTAVGGLGLVYTKLSKSDRGDMNELAMERVIDSLRRTNEAEVAAVFKQGDDGIWKGSLRSKTEINVGEVARVLGGGGHKFAAGFTGTNDIDAMIAKLVVELSELPVSNVSTDGIVLVDKPEGPTSHDVVSVIRKIFGTRKVGHAGTLDPMATGMLVLGLGKATRLLGHLAASDKEYFATIRLGMATETDDAQGTITSATPADHLSDEQILEAVRKFRGPIMQRPSSVSAIKVQGKRAYARVREGEQVKLPEREVVIQDLEILQIERNPELHIIDISVRVVCSAGTYIRALARDIGTGLGVGGHLTALRRTRSGLFTQMTPLEELREMPKLVPLPDALKIAFPTLILSDDDAKRARHGVRITAPHDAKSGLAGVLDQNGNAISLANISNNELIPVVVFQGE